MAESGFFSFTSLKNSYSPNFPFLLTDDCLISKPFNGSNPICCLQRFTFASTPPLLPSKVVTDKSQIQLENGTLKLTNRIACPDVSIQDSGVSQFNFSFSFLLVTASCLSGIMFILGKRYVRIWSPESQDKMISKKQTSKSLNVYMENNVSFMNCKFAMNR